MKKSDQQQLMQSAPADLLKKIAEWEASLWQMRVDLTQGKVKNVREAAKIRKNIARAKTVLHRRTTNI